ncbi:MAG: RNA polymerase sigma-70 factor [Candidatus Cryptobacteroides sp.]|nr:RNA polymerase sigma-70 factor [Candidatus Cryptobacteroides sp.]MDY4562611.1 RNA polymerase sigma-70 factor [Candidatus Cryptobacteroides sp.]
MEKIKIDNETLLLAALKMDSHEAFVQIFRRYYPDLVFFVSRFIPDMETCEDIVQEAFIKIWANRKFLEIRTSLKTYLVSLVQNLALNEIKHRKVKTLYRNMYHEMIMSLPADEHILYTELNDAVENLFSQLDPEVLETYMLSRSHHLKYTEIAKKLNISVRTVEARISKTIRFLQSNLKDYKFAIFLTVVFQHLFMK